MLSKIAMVIVPGFIVAVAAPCTAQVHTVKKDIIGYTIGDIRANAERNPNGTCKRLSVIVDTCSVKNGVVNLVFDGQGSEQKLVDIDFTFETVDDTPTLQTKLDAAYGTHVPHGTEREYAPGLSISFQYSGMKDAQVRYYALHLHQDDKESVERARKEEEMTHQSPQF